MTDEHIEKLLDLLGSISESLESLDANIETIAETLLETTAETDNRRVVRIFDVGRE